MPKTQDYVKRESKSARAHVDIRADVNKLLDIYCKINNKNKTVYVNEIIEKEMQTVFEKLREAE